MSGVSGSRYAPLTQDGALRSRLVAKARGLTAWEMELT
jgi:hypothetical protein